MFGDYVYVYFYIMFLFVIRNSGEIRRLLLQKRDRSLS